MQNLNREPGVEAPTGQVGLSIDLPPDAIVHYMGLDGRPIDSVGGEWPSGLAYTEQERREVWQRTEEDMYYDSTRGGTEGDYPQTLSGALCAETDPEMFFPERGSNGTDAKRICARCILQVTCEYYAMTHEEYYGIWGGTARSDRVRKRWTSTKSSPRKVA